MVQRLVKLGFMIFISGLLVSCKTVQSEPPPIVFKSAAYQPLAMNARRLEIIDNWQMPVSTIMWGTRSTLCQAMLWQTGRRMFSVNGGSGEVVFEMERVAVTLKDMPQKLDLKGLLYDQQSRKATAEIKAQIMWLQPLVEHRLVLV